MWQNPPFFIYCNTWFRFVECRVQSGGDDRHCTRRRTATRGAKLFGLIVKGTSRASFENVTAEGLGFGNVHSCPTAFGGAFGIDALWQTMPPHGSG